MIAWYAEYEPSGWLKDAGYLMQNWVHLGDVFQNRVTDHGGKSTIGKGQRVTLRASHQAVGLALLCLPEYARGRVDAGGERAGEGNRGKMTVAAANVEHWLMERQKLLIESGLN
jgi:hypothetical protein